MITHIYLNVKVTSRCPTLASFTFSTMNLRVRNIETVRVEIDGFAIDVTEDGGRGPVEAACFQFMS